MKINDLYKKEVWEQTMDSGVYKIKNTVNNLFYLGSTHCFRKRWMKHLLLLRRNKHYNGKLQQDFNHFGENCFEFEILERTCIDNLLEREKYYLHKYNTNEMYNIYLDPVKTTLGKKLICKSKRILSGPLNGMYGKKHTKETVELLKALIADRPVTEEFRKKMSEVTKGEKNGMYGRKHTDETKKKISKIIKSKNYFGENNPNYGNHWSEEMKQRASQKRKGTYFGSRKIPLEDWNEIFKLRKEGVPSKVLAEKYDCTYSLINAIVRKVKKNEPSKN